MTNSHHNVPTTHGAIIATRLLDDQGKEVRATLDIEPTIDGADLVLHARGGSGAASVNPDYFRALELLLERMSLATPTIKRISVDSRIALQMPPERRLVDAGCPIYLAPSIDMQALRIRITEAQPPAASSMPRGKPGGNKTKRIRLEFAFDKALYSAADLLHVTDQHAPLRSPSGTPFGRQYTDDPVNHRVAPTGVFSRDDSKIERALAGHATTQNALAAHLRHNGLEPRKRAAGDPDFDIAWATPTALFVAEVKSLNHTNLVQQMRVGIGQILHYKAILSLRHANAVNAVLATEMDPGDPWPRICRSADILLTWPPEWPGLAPS